jgi:tRNA (guanine-N7-)-methyltransferase
VSVRVRTHANPLRRFLDLAPPDWNLVFDDPDRSFALEFGSSKGEFLLRHAALMPHFNILGAEIRKPLVEDLSARIREAGLRNAHVIYGNVIGRLREFTPTGRIDAVYCFFPDPWPKKRHHKRRVISSAMLDELAELMPPGGVLHLMTDHPALHVDLREVCTRHAGFEEIDPPPLPAQSGWEEHCLATLRSFHVMAWRRAANWECA